MGEFDNQRVIVSGAGTGIGFAIAKEFAKAGAIVGLNDNDEQLAVQAAGVIFPYQKEQVELEPDSERSEIPGKSNQEQ
jgi:NAD(P)-dependent dehydrogenase (short-subunit alcohol dehydrogenase family)